MAKFIPHDAEGEKDWQDADISTLKKIQGYVGGLMEIVYLDDGKCLIVNEEGRLKNLPFNYNASWLARKSIVGNTILCNYNELN